MGSSAGGSRAHEGPDRPPSAAADPHDLAGGDPDLRRRRRRSREAMPTRWITPVSPPSSAMRLRARYGLDQPIHRQYLTWLGSVVTGDLGTSFVTKEPVGRLLARTLPPTLLLGAAALLLDFILGILVAVTAARRPRGWFDRLSTILGLGIAGLPSFWVAGLAVLVFALLLGWFPASHMHSVGADELPPLASARRPSPPPRAPRGLSRAGGRRRHRALPALDPPRHPRRALHPRRARPRAERTPHPVGPHPAAGAAARGHPPRSLPAVSGLGIGGHRNRLLVARGRDSPCSRPPTPATSR